MPALSTTTLASQPSNVYGLVQYLSQRLPGYDPSEYLRELNSAYIHVWEEVTKLKNHYFTNIKTVTTTKAQFAYDFLYNSDSALSAPVSNRLYQVTRIRVQPPAGGLFQSTQALSPIDPDFIAVSANPSSTPTQTGPYYWYLSGRGQANFAMPLAIGTILEVVYTFWPLGLTYIQDGTVSSSGVTVTGNGTFFTQLVQPDFSASIPTTQAQEEIQAEFIATPTSSQQPSQIFRVLTIPSNTSLTLATAPNPALAAGSFYILAILPEIPREHIRVIASIAMGKMYSVAGDDSRVQEWTAIAQSNMQMMKDSLIERQSNNPPKKLRFPYGIGRRNRAFLR